MASSSLILDSDEDNVDCADGGSHSEGALFQPISHTDKPRKDAEDTLPTWALAKPVGIQSDGQVADSQQEDLFGDPLDEKKEEKQHQKQQEKQTLQKQETLKRKKPFCDEDMPDPVTPPTRKSRAAPVTPDAAAADDSETVAPCVGDSADSDSDDLKDPQEIIKAKAADLIDDPKFKKGTVMGSLSPPSQEILKEIRKIRARDVSNTWHSKRVSKGTPRDAAGSGDSGDGGDPAAAAPVGHPVPDAEVPEESKPLNLMSERVPWSDIDVD